MDNKNIGRACLVSYRIWNWNIACEVIGALDQNLEWLKLMLSWRKFLSEFKDTPEDNINILGYVDLYESKHADV